MNALARPAVAVALAGAFGLLAGPASAAATADSCPESRLVALWFSPAAPRPGQPLRLMAVAETPLGGELFFLPARPGAQTAAGATARLATTRRGGPPFSHAAAITAPGPGDYLLSWRAAGETVACRRVKVAAGTSRSPGRTAGPFFWTARKEWDAAHEDLFALFVEQMFDAPANVTLAFRPLAEALRDPARNLLFDHLGLHEDSAKGKDAIPAAPDCADLPYFLRAYFAWKFELPFGFRDCDRGKRDRAPRCGPVLHNERPWPPAAAAARAAATPVRAFRAFAHELANTVQSGGLRTGLHDDDTDFYPVALDRPSLRPGTIYADPYGHVLVLARWFAQQGAQPGLLFAVDGQPDASITRKRFWEGNFLFAGDMPSAGVGWKAFRPLRRGRDGTLAPVRNAELATAGAAPAFSRVQIGLPGAVFFAQMNRLINPDGLSPVAAYDQMLDALVEQAAARVRSVDNGEQFMRESKGAVIEMPDGSAIFETVGAWEDYATPSRDLRLLVASKALLALVSGAAAPADVVRRHAERGRVAGFEYTRSDGSRFRLTIADLLARQAALELGYNPNDCPEIRWGAPEGSAERAPCARQAPAAQKQKMESYRKWFANTRRPARD